eukprot:UN26385
MIMEGYNLGFYSNPDGKTCECYQEVDYFHGPWPLNIGLHLHSYFVVWLTRRRIRNMTIVEDDDDDSISFNCVTRNIRWCGQSNIYIIWQIACG